MRCQICNAIADDEDTKFDTKEKLFITICSNCSNSIKETLEEDYDYNPHSDFDMDYLDVDIPEKINYEDI